MNVKKLKLILKKLKPMMDNSIPALECIHLEPGKITFTNLKIEVEFVCDSNATGLIGLADLIKTLDSLDLNDDIRFENDMESMDKSISVFVNGEKIAIEPFDDPDDYPAKMGKGKSFDQTLGKIDQKKLGYLKEALKYASNDILRPAMMNIYMHDQIASTNGHVLYFRNLQEPLGMIDFEGDFIEAGYSEIGTKSDKEIKSMYPQFNKLNKNNKWYKPKPSEELIIPIELVNFLGTVLLSEATVHANVSYESKMEDAPFHIGFGKSILCMIQMNGLKITFKVCSEKFPDYKNVIPQSELRDNKVRSQSNEVLLSFNKKELSKWIKVGLNYANKTTHQIKISIKGGEVKLQAEDLDFSKSYSKVLSSRVDRFQFMKDDKFIEKIGFNGKFLLDLVNDAKGPNVEIWMNAPNRAAIIDGYMLIMPIMLNEYV